MAYPNWVVAGVAGGLQEIVATLESLAAANAVSPALYASFKMNVATGAAPSASVAATTAPVVGLGNALVALYNMIPNLVSDETGVDPSVASGLFALCAGLVGAMVAAPAPPVQPRSTTAATMAQMQPRSATAATGAAAAMGAFAAACDAVADAPAAPVQTVNRLAAAANAELVARLTRGVLISGYVQALLAVAFADRPSAITARADCVQRFERELDLCQGWLDAVWARALTGLRDACVQYLSQAIINLKPIVTVTANIPLPSLWWAWRLYGSPTPAGGLIESMAADLIARNDVAHASFMPTSFEALAP